MHWRNGAILSLFTLIWTGCDDERDAIPCATCLAGPAGSGSGGFGGGAGVGGAPSVEREWVNVWGDMALQRATSVAIDDNDNTYVAGYYSGRVDLGGGAELPETMYVDSFLLKLDRDGTVLWAHHLGQNGGAPSGPDRVVVATSASGDIALGGNVIGTTTIGLTMPIPLTEVGMNPEIFVAKLDSEGKAVWAKSAADNSGLAVVRDIVFDAQGNVLVTGRFGALTTAGVTFFGQTIASEPMVLFAVKLDGTTGEPIWVKLYPADKEESSPNGLAVAKNGQSTICGDFMGSLFDVGGAPFLEASALNIRDAFAFHLGDDGTRDWENKYGDMNESQWAKDVTMDDAGAVYIAGSHLGALVIDGHVHDADVHDLFVAKLDNAGNRLWSWASTDPDIQEAETIAWKDEHVAVAGRFNQRLSLTIPALASLGNVDLWVGSFDLVGNPEWSRSLGGVQTQQAEAVAIGPTGAVVVVGWADGNLEIDNEVIPVAGDKDILIARFQPE